MVFILCDDSENSKGYIQPSVKHKLNKGKRVKWMTTTALPHSSTQSNSAAPRIFHRLTKDANQKH